MPRHWFVLDTDEIDAAVLGRSLMLSRGLIDSAWLECVLAHELGHYHSTDGHLTAALNRLVPWPDPLGQHAGSGLIFWIFRGAFWVAGGGAGLFFLHPSGGTTGANANTSPTPTPPNSAPASNSPTPSKPKSSPTTDPSPSSG